MKWLDETEQRGVGSFGCSTGEIINFDMSSMQNKFEICDNLSNIWDFFVLDSLQCGRLLTFFSCIEAMVLITPVLSSWCHSGVNKGRC